MPVIGDSYSISQLIIVTCTRFAESFRASFRCFAESFAAYFTCSRAGSTAVSARYRAGSTAFFGFIKSISRCGASSFYCCAGL